MIDPGVLVRPVIVRRPLGDSAPEATLYYGADCRKSLRGLPEQSVHCIVTSPPYWGLRDYGTGDAQIGLELARARILGEWAPKDAQGDDDGILEFFS